MTPKEEALTAENESLKAEIVWLKEQLAELKRIVYGQRSEQTAKVESNEGQRSLFGENDFFDQSQNPLASPAPQQQSSQYKRVKGKIVKVKSAKRSRSKK